MAIATAGLDRAALERAIALAFDRIEAFQRAMSFHTADSDLAAIASARPGDLLDVSPDTWRVLEAAIAFERDSDGDFDAAVAPSLVERGLLPRPDAATPGTGSTSSAGRSLRLLEPARLQVVQPVWIDLGGIAKGAAVDAAMSVLREHGVADAVVNAGGDLAAHGTHEQPIHVRLPWPGRGLVAVGALGDGAIATSAPPDGGAASPLVTRRGSAAVWAGRSVSVLAPSCLVADALTKVLAIRGPAAAPLLARHGARGFAVDTRGEVMHVG